MKIEILSSEFSGRQIEVVSKFAIEIEDLEKGSYSRQFEGVFHQVTKAVADEVTAKVLKERSSEIVAAIDIDEIIKRIKLNIVQNVARN